MDTVTAIRNRILELCGERNITLNKIANIAGLPPSSVKNILYGKSKNPKIITIKALCDGLNDLEYHFKSGRISVENALDLAISRIMGVKVNV